MARKGLHLPLPATLDAALAALTRTSTWGWRCPSRIWRAAQDASFPAASTLESISFQPMLFQDKPTSSTWDWNDDL